MNLDELALKYETDKGSKGHFYTRHYEKIFGEIRKTVESVMELGVGGGGSIRMWMDYFPYALVYGVDQNEVTGDFGGRARFHHYDQCSEELKSVLSDTKLEIIVDDCSHDEDKTLTTLTNLFPLLQPKGWYVIEDMNIDTFPLKIGKWVGEHSTDVDRVHTFCNKDHSSHIVFIRK